MNLKRVLQFGIPALALAGVVVAASYAVSGSDCSSKADHQKVSNQSCAGKSTATQVSNTGSGCSKGASQATNSACGSKGISTAEACIFQTVSAFFHTGSGQAGPSCCPGGVQGASGSACSKSASSKTASGTASAGMSCEVICGSAGAKSTSGSPACASGVKTASSCASGAKSASACGSGATGASGVKTASGKCCELPGDMAYTKIDVPGGVDFVFTGKGIAGLKSRISAGSDASQQVAGSCGTTFSVTTGDDFVVFSLRGEKARDCCGKNLDTFLASAGEESQDQS